jgi:tRNA(Arg) A34 adenosine deaminase TadA
MNDEVFIRLAVKEAEVATKAGNASFAVVVVGKNGEIVDKDHDRVRELMDPTAHGEVNVIRRLCKKRGTTDLSGLTFYTTSEPCPTCLTACIKAKVTKVVYGCKTEADASLPISAEWIATQSKKNPIEVVGGVLKEECLEQRKRLLKQISSNA